jgi:hypothetical protein
VGILLLQVTGIVPFIVLFGAVLFVIFLLGSAVGVSSPTALSCVREETD